MTAVSIHHTAVDSSPWDGPAQEKKLKTPLTLAVGNHAYAWRDPKGDPTTKQAWRFIHHFVSSAGLPGAASTMACSTGIAVLNGARKGTTIPETDRQGVYAHLTAHLLDAGVKEADLPKLRNWGTDSSIDEGTMTTTSDRSFRRDQRGPEQRDVTPTEAGLEMREVANGTGGTALRFSGYASVVERGYEVSDAFGPYTETVARGAFNKTLSDGADVSFLVNHTGITMARTKSGSLKLSADATGLYSEALLDPGRSDVQIVRSAVQAGDLDSMSFAFRAVRQDWNADFTERRIEELNLHQGDVSIVNYPANDATEGLVDIRGRRGLAARRPRVPMVHSYVEEEFMRLQRSKLAAAKDRKFRTADPEDFLLHAEAQIRRLKGRR